MLVGDMPAPKVPKSSDDRDPEPDRLPKKPRSRHGHRKFVVDATSMAIFWTVVYTPVFLLTSRSLEAALIGLGSAAVLEVVLGGLYGRFSDWFRAKLRVA